MNYGAEVCMSLSKARAVMQDRASLEKLMQEKLLRTAAVTDFSCGIEAQLLPEVMS